MSALNILHFAVATLLPGMATYVLSKVQSRRAWNYWTWQIICGLVFGGIAVLGTEFGIVTDDAIMNVRDAAPISAGLFFGAPAGIIAGIIGGAERWLSAMWGRGMFTRVACSLATCAAGVYAAVLRKYVFEDKRPGRLFSCITGVVAEVLHLLLVFVTNPKNMTRAYLVVRACTFPMIIANGLAVALSAVAANAAEGKDIGTREEPPSLSRLIQERLLIVMVIGLVASTVFTMALQGSLSKAKTHKLLSLALQDAVPAVGKATDDSLLALTQQVAAEIPTVQDASPETIDKLLRRLSVSQINVVNSQGIIVASSNQSLIGFDMASGTQSQEFLSLLPGGGTMSLVQDYQPSTSDPSVWRKYAGIRIGGGFVQVAYDTNYVLGDLKERMQGAVLNRHVGQEGGLVAITPDGSLIAAHSDLQPSKQDLALLDKAVDSREPYEVFTCSIDGVEYYASHLPVEWFTLIALESAEAAELERNLSALNSAYMEVLVFAALFIAVYLLIRNEVVESVWQVNRTLNKITQGDLQAEVSVGNSSEFVSLSKGINTTVASLRKAIASEAARIDQELEYARRIQLSSLPLTFPPFPEIDAFDIYALMDAAREVGGDFYDFFLIDDHTLGLLIADVAGKGIPASLFMMAAKTELSTYMSSGMSLADAVQTANWHLCQSNSAGMFVTVWAATLDYETGELTYINAGHNPPLLRHNGTWEWLRTRSGLFLGTFDSAKYRSSTLTLEPGDELLLYTDGVTEAFSEQEEQYGEERLEKFAIAHSDMHPHALTTMLRASVARWALNAEQSDDITIFALEYGSSSQATGSLTVPATLDQLDTILDAVHEALHGRSCPLSTQTQLDTIIEELFVNICNYAYIHWPEPGFVTVEYVYTANPNQMVVSLTDAGIPFNPLDQSDPEAPRSIDEMGIGGLGIMMAKRMSDDLSYVRDGDKNVVAFAKGW